MMIIIPNNLRQKMRQLVPPRRILSIRPETSKFYHAASWKSTFTKIYKGIRSRSVPDIASLAFVDPSNLACPFVVDRNAAEGANVKPALVPGRRGAGNCDVRR